MRSCVYLRTYNWDPDVMYADETGSRTPYERDEIEEIIADLANVVNLSGRLRLIRNGNRALMDHADEMWEIYKSNRRDIERQQEKIPTSRWWWYLDRPELWPPLDKAGEETTASKNNGG